MTRVQSAPPPQTTRVSLADLIDRLARFEGTPDQFLLQLLAVQCATSGAHGGAILHLDNPEKPELLALYPQLEQGVKQGPPWLGEALKLSPQVARGGRTMVVPLHDGNQLYGQGANAHLILLVIRGDAANTGRGVMAYFLPTGDREKLALAQERLELTASLLALYEMRLSLQVHRNDLSRLKQTIEAHSVVNEYQKFLPAAMAMCNEVATRWGARRVSIGFKRGSYIHLLAMSHTENLTRKTALGQAIESAMEECLDQDIEVMHPAPADATYVSRAATELATRHGPAAVLSLPLRRDGEAIGIITIERAPEKGFALDEVETLRLACDLCAPRLIDLHESDRWIGVKAVRAARQSLSVVLGVKHTGVKLIVLLVIGAIVAMSVIKGPYRADATFTIDSADYRVVAMPYQGILAEVYVDPGDTVTKGQPLGKLDTRELVLQQAAQVAELNKLKGEYAIYLRDKKTAEAQITQAKMKATEANVSLLEFRISEATLKSPLDGQVIEGDLKREIGKPIELGMTLFRVAPLKDLYAELIVPEERISDVLEYAEQYALDQAKDASAAATTSDKTKGSGTLALASHPGDYIPFDIERINPVAEMHNQRNSFRVIVRLKEERDHIRPGNQGLAKIDLGREPYGWIWTRSFVDWVRMTFWI